MKILLVYPQFPEKAFWKFSHALRFVGKKAAMPPMGLLTAAALLPKDWDLRLVDMNCSNLKDEDILWADFVFISAMVVQKNSVEVIIQRCIELDRKIVAGGPLFTALHERYGHVHHLILNEAEITLPQFLDDIRDGNPKKVYRTEEWADISKTPVPLWDLVDLKNYATMGLQFSRGCPFECDFCDITVLFGPKPRIKNTENVRNASKKPMAAFNLEKRVAGKCCMSGCWQNTD